MNTEQLVNMHKFQADQGSVDHMHQRGLTFYFLQRWTYSKNSKIIEVTQPKLVHKQDKEKSSTWVAL